MSAKNNFKKIAISATVAGVAGYVLGILSSPTTTKQLKHKLKKLGIEDYQSAEIKIKQLQAEINELISSVKEGKIVLDDKTSKKYEDVLTTAKKTKEHLATIIDKLKQNDTKDKDLEQAIKEAEKAISHVKDFLLKK